jgi:hypothetical protein
MMHEVIVGLSALLVILIAVLLQSDKSETKKDNKEHFYPIIVNSGYGFAYPGQFGQWPYRPSLMNWNGHIAYPNFINNFYADDEPVCWKRLNATDVFRKPFVSKRQWFLALQKLGVKRYLQPKRHNQFVLVATQGDCSSGRLSIPDATRYFDVRI